MSWTRGAVRTGTAWVSAGLAAVVLLSGCESIRQATGAEKTPPDEFTVLTKAPLVIPPDYNLRPPQPGIASRNDPDADETGAALALPTASAAGLDTSYSDGEKLLLTKTNALSVDPNIRKTITSDVGLEDQGPGFAQKVLFQGATPPKPVAPAAMAAPAAAPAAPATAAPAAPAAAAIPAPAASTPAPAANP
ncbi:MAG TPA: DUF3035 domain-containing protein [Micropepsaceae bacterium]|nr:DUF3035 domain-containing protein [Micropepsaceae bacterium]